MFDIEFLSHSRYIKRIIKRFPLLCPKNMDSEALLARENEFKKLNKQLEKKSEILMKEIENSVQKQDLFSEFFCNVTSPPERLTNKHCCSPKEITTNNKKGGQMKKNIKNFNLECKAVENGDLTPVKDNMKLKTQEKGTYTEELPDTKICNCLFSVKNLDKDLEFLYAFVSINVKDNVLPSSFLKDKVTVESVCKFLSAKTSLMQEQIDKLQSTIDSKAKQCDNHMTQLAEYESERLTLLNRANTMKCETVDMKAKYSVLQNKLNEKDRLYKEQRSTTDKQTIELKQIRSRNINLEARCASQEEVISTLKQQLETAKLMEKEFRDSSRSLSASHQTTITRLDTKLKALTCTIDKQTSLIDNLRKQNALLQTDGALRALEKEYSDFLNQDL